MVIVGLGMSVMRRTPTPARSLTHALLRSFMVFPMLIGSVWVRTSPGLSATLPYKGRARVTSAAVRVTILALLSSE